MDNRKKYQQEKISKKKVIHAQTQSLPTCYNLMNKKLKQFCTHHFRRISYVKLTKSFYGVTILRRSTFLETGPLGEH